MLKFKNIPYIVAALLFVVITFYMGLHKLYNNVNSQSDATEISNKISNTQIPPTVEVSIGQSPLLKSNVPVNTYLINNNSSIKEQLFKPNSYTHTFSVNELNHKYYSQSFLFLYSDLRSQIISYCSLNVQPNQIALTNCQNAEIANGSWYPITIAASYLFNHMFSSILAFLFGTILLYGMFIIIRLYIGGMLLIYKRITILPLKSKQKTTTELGLSTTHKKYNRIGKGSGDTK